MLNGCESDELNENDGLFKFWCNKFVKNEIERRDFKVAVWLLMTPVN